EYAADDPFDALAASLERRVAWLRRGAVLTRLELAGLRERSCELPASAIEILDRGGRPIGVVVSENHAIIGVVGQARVLWCALQHDRLRVTTFDARSPVFDGFASARGPVILCGGARDSVLLSPSTDGLSELDRRKANVASVLVDDSGAQPRLVPDALSQRGGLTRAGAQG
ncbi:MAG: hypothetical protein KC468_34400, partial [Myxococcales bacterium]|nr:hypothetical protein [Myxococcales bacterium]